MDTQESRLCVCVCLLILAVMVCAEAESILRVMGQYAYMFATFFHRLPPPFSAFLPSLLSSLPPSPTDKHRFHLILMNVISLLLFLLP